MSQFNFFIAWLAGQRRRGDLIGEIARHVAQCQAVIDRGTLFDINTLRRNLTSERVDPELLLALDVSHLLFLATQRGISERVSISVRRARTHRSPRNAISPPAGLVRRFPS